MTYLAACNGPCSSFSGSTGNVWVKIDQSGYDANETVPWYVSSLLPLPLAPILPTPSQTPTLTPLSNRASKRLPTQNSTYTLTLPSTIAPGNYILRHEILGLQRTNTDGSLAQFYPNCHQVTVTGSGTAALPEGIALPGAYKSDDTTSVSLRYLYCLSWEWLGKERDDDG